MKKWCETIFAIPAHTSPSAFRIRTIRRQSSIGAYQDHPVAQHAAAAQASVPISSSTSYYTNSPSPPHVADQNIAQTQELSQRLERTLAQTDELRHADELAQQRLSATAHLLSSDGASSSACNIESAATNLEQTTNLAQFLHSNILETHSDLLVLSRSQFDYMTGKIESLSRKVQSLEQNLATDIRLILNLLQNQNQQTTKEPITVKHEVHSFFMRFAQIKTCFSFVIVKNCFVADSWIWKLNFR